MTYQELEPGRIMRRAILKEIDQLIKICRDSFPRTLRWQLKGNLARRWWKCALVSQAVETWVIEENGYIAGVCVLVTYEPLWAKEKQARRGSIVNVLPSALRHPIVATRFLASVWRDLKKKETIATLCHRQMPVGWDPGMRTWIELIAIRPDRRKRGMAEMLLEHCNRRTRELGRKAVVLHVASDNTPAKSL